MEPASAPKVTLAHHASSESGDRRAIQTDAQPQPDDPGGAAVRVKTGVVDVLDIRTQL